VTNTHVYSNVNGGPSARPLYFFLKRYMDSYTTEMKEFVDCIVNDLRSPVAFR
jgi:hypothetical protein